MKHLKLFLGTALLLLATTAQAQSTYSWNASDWAHAYSGNGTVTESSGTLTCTGGQWCGSVSFEGTAFKLPKRQTFIVIKGTDLVVDGGDPNVCNFSGDLGGSKLGYFTGNDAHTLIYKDITSLLPSETDFFGNVTISSVALYLKLSKDATCTITSIDFVAADLLDVATNSNVGFTNNGDLPSFTLTQAADGIKKTLSFTQTTTNGDMAIDLTGINALINRSDMFFVLEANVNTLGTAWNSALKLRQMAAGGTYTWENSAAGASMFSVDDHYVYIHSPYQNNTTNWQQIRGMKELYEAWKDTPYMNSTMYKFYVANTQNQEVTIYRMGFYNLSEIFDLYPSLATQSWRFMHPTEGEIAIENGGSNTAITINNDRSETEVNTVFYGSQLIRSLGNDMPSSFATIELYKLNMLSTETPTKEDIFAGLPNVNSIIFANTDYVYFPTMNDKVMTYFANKGYYQYKDGTAPGSVSYIVDHGDNGNTASLTRQFVAGYSSLILPFDVTVTDLTAIGITPYVLGNISESSVSFTEATGTISANTPFIVNVAEAGLYLIPSASTPNIVTTLNDYYTAGAGTAKFVGSYVQKVPDGDYASTLNFGLKADGTAFARMGDATKTSYYRAFLALPASSSSRQSIAVNFDDDATGIEEIVNSKLSNGKYYNLSGQRVANPTKGLYIINGKKVLVK